MRAVIALGGNALSARAEDQEKELRNVAAVLAPILVDGHEIVLVHGNGPQVGIVHSAFERAVPTGGGEVMPFYDCTAMNVGGIGYHLEQAVASVLDQMGRGDMPLATVVTRIEVDPHNKALMTPDKPVGRFYTEKEARELMRRTGRTYGPDSGRGWRLMVPSPPVGHIIDADAIRCLVEAGVIVIGGGAAGIPVCRDESGVYRAVEAVCDKDLTSAQLAKLIDADLLLILTAVDYVAINYGTTEQRNLKSMTPSEAERYIRDGQFSPGSMLPKVEACVQFVRSRPGGRAVIGNLREAEHVLKGKTGTVIAESA